MDIWRIAHGDKSFSFFDGEKRNYVLQQYSHELRMIDLQMTRKRFIFAKKKDMEPTVVIILFVGTLLVSVVIVFLRPLCPSSSREDIWLQYDVARETCQDRPSSCRAFHLQHDICYDTIYACRPVYAEYGTLWGNVGVSSPDFWDCSGALCEHIREEIYEIMNL